MTGCYSCHKASEKGYLRPRIPEHPATTMINFDPNATPEVSRLFARVGVHKRQKRLIDIS